MSTTHLLGRLYASLYRIRRVEERVAEVYPTDKIKSPIHLSIGQEYVSVGVCEALSGGDVVFGTYRGHALYLARGGSLPRMLAELYGKATGCAGGKGGSMHLVDAARGVMPMSAVVGTNIPESVGYAYALKVQQRPAAMVACFFGDGATEEGAFSESLNFAALRQLPVLFVCENNGLAINTPIEQRQANPDICARARALGVPAARLDPPPDVVQLHRRVQEVVQGIRGGGGPYLLECVTYRWKEHVGPGEDFDLGYRGRDQLRPWVERDPLAALAAELEDGQRARLEAEVEAEINAAFRFAEESPFPGPEQLHQAGGQPGEES